MVRLSYYHYLVGTACQQVASMRSPADTAPLDRSCYTLLLYIDMVHALAYHTDLYGFLYTSSDPTPGPSMNVTNRRF